MSILVDITGVQIFLLFLRIQSRGFSRPGLYPWRSSLASVCLVHAQEQGLDEYWILDIVLSRTNIVT